MSRVLPVAKRKQKRERVWLTGQVGGGDWHQEVRIRDLSEGGALVECETPLRVDTIVSLFCGSIEVPARVAWVGNHFAGVQFLSPIDHEILVDQLGSALRVSAPRMHSGFSE